MLVSQFLTEVNYALRGIDDDPPTFGTDEANYWLATFNRKKNELYQDVSKQWGSTYQVLEVEDSIVASANPTYNLSATFLAPANNVYVIDSEDRRHDFDLIEPQAKVFGTRQFYVAGMNPQVLTCTTEITASEQIIGGALYLPGYFMPADVALEADTIPIDDPYWGVMATAAEIAFGDLTYEDKYGDLNAKANALYSQMVRRNRRGTYGNPRTSTYDVPKIRGF